MIVNLHIERLVLDGLPVGSHEGPLVQAAVEAELGRLLAEGDTAERFAGDRNLPLVRADAALLPVSRPDLLGVRIGRALHGAVGT